MAVTSKCYNQLVTAFREHGNKRGRWVKAALAAGTDWRTAKRAFYYGWPQSGMPPIEELLEQEAAEHIEAADVSRAAEQAARAEAAQLAAEERAKTLRAAAEHKRVEGEVANGLLNVAGRLLTNTVKLHRAAEPLVVRIQTTLELITVDDAGDGKSRPKGLTVHEQVRLLRELGRYSEQVCRVSRHAIAVHRAHLDRPELGMGLGGGVADGVDEYDEAKRIIAEAEDARRRTEQRVAPELRVVEGGLGRRVT